MIRRWRRWWHAGEDGATAVYGNNFLWLVLFLLFIVVACSVLGLALNGEGVLILVVVTLLPVAFIFPTGMARVAIIFTETAVIYRPYFGRPKEAPYAEIVNVRRIFIPGFRMNYHALELKLASGEILRWDLMVSYPNEVLERLERSAGKSVEQSR